MTLSTDRTFVTESAIVKAHSYSVIRMTDTYALVSSKSQPDTWRPVKDGRCCCPGYANRSRCAHVDALKSLDLQAAIAAAEAEVAAAEMRVRNLQEAAEALAAPAPKALPTNTCQPDSRTAARATLARLPESVKAAIL